MTQTSPRNIADTKPQASPRDPKTAKAAQRSIDKPNLATEHAERSDSASSAATSTCTENATEGHTANNPVPSAPENPAPTDLALPTNSTTSAAVTRVRKSKSSPPEPEEDTAETARRGRKRKSVEFEAPEPTNKMARISNGPEPASALVMQASRIQIAEDEIKPEPWRAPVARMY